MTKETVTRVGLIAGVCALVLSGTATATQQAALVVERAEVVRGQLAVTVRNVGDRTIAAWTVEGRAFFDDNTIGTGRVTTDGYDSLARGSTHTSSLPPNGRYTIKMHVPAPAKPAAVVSVDAAPTAVVFDNDVAVGDDDDISLIFRDRVLTAQTWRLFEQLTMEWRAAPPTAATIEAMRSRWASIEDPTVRRGLVHSEISRHLSDALAKASRQDPREIQQFIQRISAEATTKRATAEAHSNRQ